MHIPSVKRILLIIFLVILLIAIPVTIYLVSQQKSKATETPTATLTLVPATQSVNQGDNLSLDVSMDPGENNVSTITLLISYDTAKLATVDGSFVPNSAAFPSVVSGPTYQDGTIAVTLAIGSNSPTIQTTTKVGTLNFKALEATDTAPTQIAFNSQTSIVTANGTNQNVLSSAAPATVNIALATETPTPFPTIAESISPALTLTPTPTTNQTQTVSTNGPVCLSFTADRPTTGTTPFDVNFTLKATDSAAIISKATFNFGDGQTQDITSANGLGENPITVNSLALHTYTTTGTFVATGSITDVNGNVSDSGTCSITVIVNSASTSTESAGLTPVPSPLPPTGNNSITIIAIFGLILTFAGAFILILL